MQTQSVLVEENPPVEIPIVTLKNGTSYARRTVKFVMDCIKKLQTDPEITNGALLLADLVGRCNNAEHEFYPGCQWKLAELGLLDTDGHAKPSVRDIVLSAVTGEGMDIGFGSPIAT